jgi:hypothetical protein
VAGRAQAFSDPTVIRLASEEFIPVAENSSALERQADDKGIFFRHVAEQGHYGGRIYPTTTRQGSYTFTADGHFLASVNTRDPRGMAEMLELALTRWRDGYEGHGPAPAQLVNTTAESGGCPEGGLILQLAARDLPREVDQRPDDWRKIAWNLDYAWITRDEARALVPEPRTIGNRRAAPWAIVRRLARFHLRDFVRGEPVAWPEEAIRHGELWAEITAVTGDQVQLNLSGAVRLELDVHWVRPEDGEERHYPSGYDCTLQGEATWDEQRGVFTAFDLVAVGQRWGANQYNNRDDDLGPAPLGITFALAGDAPSDRTPPHCLRTWRRSGDQVRPSRVIVGHDEYFGGGRD